MGIGDDETGAQRLWRTNELGQAFDQNRRMPSVSQPESTRSERRVVVIWFRRDLRIDDNAALNAAISRARESSAEVLALFVLDPTLAATSGANRLAYLYDALRSLVASGLPLLVCEAKPTVAFERLLTSCSIRDVFCAEEFTPYARRRDQRVEKLLSDRGATLHRVGSPYVVKPGVVRKDDGTPFKVFTPFKRVWERTVAPEGRFSGFEMASVPWVRDHSPLHAVSIPPRPSGASSELPEASEKAAHSRLTYFVENNMSTYDVSRNDPAADATSRISADLKYGLLHPSQILPMLAGSSGADVFRSELCWREFYADVLFHRPETVTSAFNPMMDKLVVDSGPEADARFEAWCRGETGFPFVDAGMRQLLREGWMHNRVRMVTASFLVKDLHLDWRRGADWFMTQLVDGDIASNQHGWQWTAGTGTDASPYYRVFNPVMQGKKFDPTGAYVRKYVPELGDLDGDAVHEPWATKGGGLFGGVTNYPAPIVDHAAERVEALARYAAAKG